MFSLPNHPLQTDEDIPQSFMQNFVLKPANDSFFIQHDVFRWKEAIVAGVAISPTYRYLQ